MAGKNFVDPLLTRIAKGYRPSGHINEMVLPELPVNEKSAKIGVYDGSNMRIVSTVKAPEGETPTVTFDVSQEDAYTLENHALKAFASDERAKNQQRPFDEQRDKTEFAMDLLSVAREYGLANYMNTASNFTNKVTLSGTDQWGGSSDDPLGDINTAVGTVADEMLIPEEEVSLVIQRKVFRELIFLSEVKDLLGFKHNQTRIVRPEELAQALGVKKVLIGQGRYNSASDGQSDSFTDLWGKHCWAVYIPDRPGLKQHSFGYTCRRRGAVETKKWRDEDREGWWVKPKDEYDQYIMNEKGVYMIKDAIA